MNVSSLNVFANSNSNSSNTNLFSIKKELDGQDDSLFVARDQFIGLIINNNEFLLDVPHIHEIIMLPKITFVPNSPQFIEGVVNLRGNIIPVINLRKLLSFPRGEVSVATRVIITKINDELVGLLVDAITYVVSLLPSEIEPQTIGYRSMTSEIINRVAKLNDRILGVFDINKIVLNARGNHSAEEADKA